MASKLKEILADTLLHIVVITIALYIFAQPLFSALPGQTVLPASLNIVGVLVFAIITAVILKAGEAVLEKAGII